jgi:O-antigen ligase
MVIINEKKIKQNFIYVFLIYIFISGMLSHKVLYLEYLFLVLALFEALMSVARRRLMYDFSVLMVVLPFIVLTLMSMFFNKTNISQYLEIMPYYLKGFLLFLFITIYKNYFGESEFYTVNKIILGGVFLQVPITIYQYLNWDGSKTVLIEDAAYGSLGKGAANDIGYIMVIFVIFCIMVWNYTKNRKYLLLILPMLITLVISESKIGYILFVLLLIMIFVTRLNVKFFIIGSLTTYIFYKILISIDTFSKSLSKLSLDAIYKSQMSLDGSRGRLYYLQEITDLLSRKNFLFGFGPGNFLSYIGQKTNPILFYKFVPIDWIGSIDSQICVILSEMGFSGLISFIFILVFFFIKIFNSKIRKENMYLRALKHWFLLYIVFFIILAFVNLSWQSTWFSYWFWIYLGFITNLLDKEKSIMKGMIQNK